MENLRDTSRGQEDNESWGGRQPRTPELGLLLLQYKLEQEMQEAGRKAWREAMEAADAKAEGMAHAKRAHLLLDALPPLTERVARELKPRNGRPSDLRQMLGELSAECVAYTALRVLVNDTLDEQTQQTTAIRIGEALDREVMLCKARDENSTLWWGVQDIDNLSQLQSRLKEIKLSVSQHQRASDFTKQHFRIGNKLIQLALQYTGLFEIRYYSRSKRRRSNRIVFTIKAKLELEQLQSKLMKLAPPQYQPLVCPPKPWKSMDDGGYVSLPLPLIKSRGHNPYDLANRKAVTESAVPSVFAAVSILQAVPWRLNTDVLAVMKRLLERRASNNSLKTAMEKDHETATDVADEGSDPATKWIDRKVVKELLEPHFNEPFQHFAKVVALAHLCLSRPVPFFFAWQVDFRGRAYPVVTHLHPQGHGSARALLEFSEGRPLGKTGQHWLAVHGANMLKAPVTTRETKIAWVHDHEQTILDTAKDPRSTLEFWALTSSRRLRKTAWEALAFCLEWARLHRDGSKFINHLPVAMDGTCNAIQHMAVMIGDPELARLSNVIPSSERVDVYGEVAQMVLEQIKSAPSNPNKNFLCDLPIPLADIINRDLCKVPVMTTPYGATPYGRRNQVRNALADVDAFEAKIDSLPPAERRDTRWSVACYVADAITDVLTEKLGPADKLMSWLQHSAEMMVRHKKPVRWLTPAGFPVMQAYLRNKSRIIKTEMSRLKRFRRFSLTVKLPTSQLAVKKARNGIVANFVHSHDAAHMMRTAVAAHREGITDLRMIHDSFATHAGNADALARILRDEFAVMYAGNDMLGRFYGMCAEELGPAAQDLKRPPDIGQLDVNSVRESRYFFS